MAADPHHWKRMGHIPMLIILQIIFIVLFAKFVVYDEHSAIKNVGFDHGGTHALFEEEIANPEPNTDSHQGHNHGTAKEEEKTPHETTRDAKEILTDYPSMRFFLKNKIYIIRGQHIVF